MGAPTRCLECWNIKAYCMCAAERRESMSHHPSARPVTRPTVAGITPEERDRLLAAYAARGVTELEELLKSD